MKLTSLPTLLLTSTLLLAGCKVTKESGVGDSPAKKNQCELTNSEIFDCISTETKKAIKDNVYLKFVTINGKIGIQYLGDNGKNKEKTAARDIINQVNAEVSACKKEAFEKLNQSQATSD